MGGGDKDILEADMVGYYSYLPATFIYKNYDWDFIKKSDNEYIRNSYVYVINEINGKPVNRYFIGLSYLMLPFFIAGHIHALLYGVPADGYSWPYLIWINIGAIMYFMVGLYFLIKVLRQLFSFKESTLSILMITAAFGTNLFYYAILEPGLSHIYSFALVNIFAWLIIKERQKESDWNISLIIVILALIIIVRPVNILILIILPLLLGSLKNTWDFVVASLKFKKGIFIGIIVATCLFLPQLLVYKSQTGSFLVDSYQGHYFNWLDPHFMDILFSYRKGLFLYIPITFISLPGLYFLGKKNIFLAIWWILSFILITYVLSSWSCWSYGACFGPRPFIEYYILFFILLGFLIEKIRTPWKPMVISVITILVLVCQIQIYQYRYYFIHWDEMNKEKYWKVFLRIDYLIKKTPHEEVVILSNAEIENEK
jgi:hypothetical protein